MIDPPHLPDGYEFHHIGYATTSLEQERQWFEFLGYRLEAEPFVDPLQGVAGCFMVGPGPRVELLENLPGSTTLTPWINAGVKMYHFAYLVDDLPVAIEWARGRRAKVVSPPAPAAAFGGRRIAFVLFRNGFLLEFVENSHSSTAR